MSGDNGKEDQIIFKATVEDNCIKINICNGNEMLLCTALHKLRLMVDGLIAMREMEAAKKARSSIITPGQAEQEKAQSLLDRIRRSNG